MGAHRRALHRWAGHLRPPRLSRGVHAQSNIELVVVRRIPTNPAQAAATANPLFAQKNSFGTAIGWAVVS